MAAFRITMLMMQLATGLLITALSIPLMRGKIGPNPWYGFRVRRTLEDPAVWYKANAYAGKALIVTGIVMVLGSLALYPVPWLDGPAYAIACAVVTLGTLAVSVALCFRFLGRITHDSEF